ncbi:MAG: undecaprenyl/decaprenyl-phosphate alpha-N-acetylglucosaminyl 1-phosphate transferase [Sedimentisphaerales bacterium]|nr:undecaprenyl/decaprenyl-phosphate alpha-N-acetylglucosaminyl 1-phosphate transferase [Sedimentisphaerales bacterium]
MKTYLCVYLGTFLLAVVLTPAVIWLARRINAVDRPGVRTIHQRPIPRIGGIAIFFSTLVMIVAVVFLDNAVGIAFRQVRLQLVTLLGCAAFIFGIGLIDDWRGLPARIKFVGELLAAGILCAVGVRITEVRLTEAFILNLGWGGYLLTLLWITGITNAVNMSDGLDGLAAGISTIACGVIATLSIHNGDSVMAVFMLALVGSLSGFLVFNFNPAKVFLGDCGSLFIGFTIAASSVMCMTKSTAFVGLALPALALGIPIFDTLFSMLRRFLERRSMFAPDKSHFHHYLLRLGLHQKYAVVAIYLATLIFTGLGLFMMVNNNSNSLVVFGCVLVLILILFRLVGVVQLRDTITRLKEKYSQAQGRRENRKTFEDLQLRFQQVKNQEQWFTAVCQAAERMDFAWISLKTTENSKVLDEEIWRAASNPENKTRIVTMIIPFDNGKSGLSRQLEIAIFVNGSLETAGQRATLFTRLLDEHELFTPLPLIYQEHSQTTRY